ncbi:hypothetical protein EG68_06676 [Paragonimus skrjabini miyazakii]|uniref:CBS domain-containing protein n=1 Tax=Paragonimus skrjabini miyazakii TaxID=59628 RepID=A0A8S9YPM3_9TREM|nr:hypothetical protein EG68_06676 [Paragonimus skrjabini miyazakii]
MPKQNKKKHAIVVNRLPIDGKECLIFRNQNSSSGSSVTIESLELKQNAFFYFFKHHTCYDLLPASAKLVILDTELRIKKAFYALVFNNVRSAILWDSSQQTFVGILTITDFIKVLVNNFEPKLCRMGGFETETISEWRSLDPKTAHHPLVYTSPESSLLEAARLLIKHRFHRLPIIDPVFGNPLHILTHKRILKYLYLNRYKLPQSTQMSQTLDELRLGTYVPSVHVIRQETPIIDALRLFLIHNVSCLPVVDANNRLTELYAKFDVFNLAVTRSYTELHMSVHDALAFHRHNRERYPHPLTCLKTDKLESVIERVVKSGVHRLIIVDQQHLIEGLISLSDILKFLISEPPSNELANNIFSSLGVRSSSSLHP